LRSVENQPGIPASIKNLPSEAAGLLVEFQAADVSQRQELEQRARDAVQGFRLLEPAAFTHHAGDQALLWKVRQGDVSFCWRRAQEWYHRHHRGRSIPDRTPGRRNC